MSRASSCFIQIGQYTDTYTKHRPKRASNLHFNIMPVALHVSETVTCVILVSKSTSGATLLTESYFIMDKEG